MQFFTLACCANNADLFAWIPRELRFEYLLLSIFLGSYVNEQFLDLPSYSPNQINLLLDFCVSFGDPFLLKRNLNIIPTIEALNYAAQLGNIAQVECLLDLGLLPTLDTLNWAAASGNLTLVQYLLAMQYTNGYPFLIPTFEIFDFAQESGNVELVDFLFRLGIRDEDGKPIVFLPQNMLNLAIATGDLPYLQYLLAMTDENGNPRFTLDDVTLSRAVDLDKLEMVLYLLALRDENNNPCVYPSKDMVANAAEAGNLVMVQVLLASRDESGKPISFPMLRLIKSAAESGNAEFVNYLLALKNPHGKPYITMTIDIVNSAVTSGNLALTRALLLCKDKNGNPIIPTSHTLSYAAETNNLALVREILMLKKANGEFLLGENDLLNVIDKFRGPAYIGNYIHSHREILLAYRALLENKFDAVASHLTTAYESFSLYFFTEIRVIEQDLKLHRNEKAILFLQQTVANFVQLQLQRTDLPSCEIALLTSSVTSDNKLQMRKKPV
jgi:hypothetical protein